MTTLRVAVNAFQHSVQPMTSADHFPLKAHRERILFYYERASPLEASVMDALCSFNLALTLAVNAPREHLPEEVMQALDRTTDALEGNFMEAVGLIREGTTFRSLTQTQKAIVVSCTFNIRFGE